MKTLPFNCFEEINGHPKIFDDSGNINIYIYMTYYMTFYMAGILTSDR